MPDQRSLTDQLASLLGVAVERGMYDAADWLQARLTKDGARICPRCEHVVERGEWHIPDPEHMGYGACIVQGQPLPHNAAPENERPSFPIRKPPTYRGFGK